MANRSREDKVNLKRKRAMKSQFNRDDRKRNKTKRYGKEWVE